MRVGVCFPHEISHGPVRWAIRSLLESLSSRHDVTFPPHGYGYARADRQRLIFESFVRQCDIIIGLDPVAVLAVRNRIGSTVPFIAVELGNLPRGAWALRTLLPHLTTNDATLVTCTSDAHLAGKFVTDLAAHVAPLSYDDEVFFAVEAHERAALRAKHGFLPDDKILIYAGRGRVSKNVLTLVRVFSALVRIVPNVHLILAGDLSGLGGGLLSEIGVWPVHFAHTLERLIATLALPRERLHLLGHVEPGRLRELYNIADVKVNLTLHHDENFGLTQVEAMACGTPVVGSAWGGLKDTIVDGTSGYKVSVAVSSTGVKANWWEAVSKIAFLLTNPAECRRLRASCIQHARTHYAPAVVQRRLLEVVSAIHQRADTSPRPLAASRFAQEYWTACAPVAGVKYRPGDRSFELYTELIATYCGSSPDDVALAEPLENDQVLCLAWPVRPGKNGGVRPDDPHCPFELHVPPQYQRTFQSVMAVMRRRPVITVGELTTCVSGTAALHDALRWMLSVVLLRSRPSDGVAPSAISEHQAGPVLAVERVDPETVDFIAYS